MNLGKLAQETDIMQIWNIKQKTFTIMRSTWRLKVFVIKWDLSESGKRRDVFSTANCLSLPMEGKHKLDNLDRYFYREKDHTKSTRCDGGKNIRGFQSIG